MANPLLKTHTHTKKKVAFQRVQESSSFFLTLPPHDTQISYFLLLFLTHSTMSALSFYRRQYWISYYGANDCFGRTHLYEPICIRREVHRESNGVRLNLLEALCLLQNSTTGARPRVGCKGRVKVNAINGERFKTVNARLCERCKRDNNNNNNNNNKNN